MAQQPILAILGPLENADGTPARQNGGTLKERLAQMDTVDHSVVVRPTHPQPIHTQRAVVTQR